MSLFTRIFRKRRPYEVTWATEAVQTFFRSGGWGPEAKVIEDEVTALVKKQQEKTIYSIRVDQMKPDHLALMLITNALAGRLQSGQFHTYRGVLSMTGTELLNIWDAAIKQLHAKGYYSDAKYEEDRTWIRNEIKSVG
jgi:hypothetical protein